MKKCILWLLSQKENSILKRNTQKNAFYEKNAVIDTFWTTCVCLILWNALNC